MHGISKKLMSEGQNRAAPRPARSAAGFTRRVQARQPALGPFWPKKGRFGPPELQPFAYRRGAPILMAMTVHFPFQNTYAALPANFFPPLPPTPPPSPPLIKLNRPPPLQLALHPA